MYRRRQELHGRKQAGFNVKLLLCLSLTKNKEGVHTLYKKK